MDVVLLDKKEKLLKKVFLSGGMTGLTTEEAIGWRNSFKYIVYDAYENRNVLECIDPTCFYFSENETPADDVELEAMRYDIYWVKNCDALVANMNNIKSIGTAQEIMLAYTCGKPIILIVNQDELIHLHYWIKEEASKIITWSDDVVDALSDAADYILTHYV